MKILVVDDEKLLVKGLKYNLEQEGYQVITAFDGEEAVRLAHDSSIDLILLDVMLPKIDGLTACRNIREFSNIPIIMLTARSEDIDKILGLEYGADDYITKPFNVREVISRIKAIIRRVNPRPKDNQSLLISGDITLDYNFRRASVKDKVIELTGKECVVVGRSNIVGKPQAMLLLHQNATVTICHSRTKDLKEVCKRADVLVVAVGRAKMIDASYIKEGAVVIDVGMDRDENGKLCGDVDFDSACQVAGAITPVPGGVGPMTIATLMKNAVTAAEKQICKK